jgi:hypothetical protein
MPQDTAPSITAKPASIRESSLFRLLSGAIGEQRAEFAIETLHIDPALLGAGNKVARAQIATALNAALFVDLLDRVPTAARYVGECRDANEAIVFDHGALRTIDGDTGALVPGYGAFSRFLVPLGYVQGGLYPLPALKMTGRAFVHRDYPEAIPQFFVSELHVSELHEDAQSAAARVFGNSLDPLGEADRGTLDVLENTSECSLDAAVSLLPVLLLAFGRQHRPPSLADYETLLLHSKEAAWIATEGNAFNHATTRVDDVEQLAEKLSLSGYPMKAAVEVSQNRRVRQTAFLADKVLRQFRADDGSLVEREVPGSFYEFISRERLPEGPLDLTFDSGNATGIFAVTSGQ